MDVKQNSAVGSAPSKTAGSTVNEAADSAENNNNRARPVQVKFYVTAQERSVIDEKMRLAGTTNLSAYLRKMAVDGYIIKPDYSELKAVAAQMQKLGTNINQIAKRVNQTGSAATPDIKEIKEAVETIWRLLRLSLLKAR